MLTAGLGIPILLGLIYVGGWVLAAGTAAMAAIGVFELHRMFQNRGLSFFPRLAVVWTWALLAAPLAGISAELVLSAGWGVAAIWTLTFAEGSGFQGALTTSWGAMYLGWFFSFMNAIRGLPHGRALLFGVFLVVWSTDTLAFFGGRAWGRARLLPRVSPGKTWVGAIIGTVAGTLAGVVATVAVGQPWPEGLLVGVGISVVGQLGDLVESNLKRWCGVKDSGSLLPGHGGILDRFDSALFALPLAYYLFRGLGIG